jgi:hypothetical protein
VHCTLGVDTGATNPLWRVDSIEVGGMGVERGEVTLRLIVSEDEV